jgi:LAGLIDADG-like domain
VKRLSAHQVRSIQRSAKKGLSINRISRLEGLSKSTVHYWYNKIIKHPKKEIVINRGSEKRIGEFIGIFAGDGSYCMDNSYKHQIRIHLNAKDQTYVDHVSELMTYLFKRKPSAYLNSRYNVTVLRLVSKDILNFIRQYLSWTGKKTYSVQLNGHVSLSKEFIVGFLKGLLDTDGHLNCTKKCARYSTVSTALANDIKSALGYVGIRSSDYIGTDKRGNRMPIHRVTIHRDFDKLVSLVHPKHFNYLNESNSQMPW